MPLREFVLQRERGVVARGYEVAKESDAALARHELPEGMDVGLADGVQLVCLEA